MSESDKFLNTVEAVHLAAVDAEHSPQALRAIAALFGGVGATHEVFLKQPMRLVEFRGVGMPSQAEIAYLAHHALDNPRAADWIRDQSRDVLFDYAMLDERAMDRAPFYAKFLQPMGLRYFIAGQIVNTKASQGIVSVQRSPRQGHVDRRDIDRMRRLLPHLCQAHDVSTRLRRADRAWHSLEQALDWLADGVMLVRGDRRVVYANAAAQAMVRRGDGIRIVGDVLEFASHKARGALAAALEVVARGHAGDAPSPRRAEFAVPRAPDLPAYQVSVRPLVAREGVGVDATAMVFIHDSLRRASATHRALRDVLGLTDAEADLAHALQAGVAPGTYARQRAVSINTVYTHLRRIKEKTGCKRLTELIHRLSELRTPLRDG